MNESPRRYLTIPNALSAVRILLVVPLLYFFRAEMFLPTLALFLISAVSDAADGAIARRWNMQSEFGRVLDPLADKVTFVTLIVVFGRNILDVLPIAILVTEEVILLCMGTCRYVWPNLLPWTTLGANIYGKIKTSLETLLVVLLLTWHFFSVPYGYLFIPYTVMCLCIIFAFKSIVGHLRLKPLS